MKKRFFIYKTLGLFMGAALCFPGQGRKTAGLSGSSIPASITIPAVDGWVWSLDPQGDGSVRLSPTGSPRRSETKAAAYGRLALSDGGILTPLPESLPVLPAGYFMYDGEGTSAPIEGRAREWAFPAVRLGDIEVSRQVLFARDGRTCRWLNILRNTSARRRVFFVLLDGRYAGDGTGGGTILTSGDIPDSAKKDTWILSGLSTGSGSRLTLAHVLEGPGTKAPIVGGEWKGGGPAVSRVSGAAGPSWAYQVTLEPGETGILMNALVLDASAEAVTAALRRPARLHRQWLEGTEAAERGRFLNFLYAEGEVTLIQPIEGTSYATGIIPILVRVSGISLQDLSVGATAYGPCDDPSHPYDPAPYYHDVYDGPWEGGDFSSQLDCAEKLYVSTDGTIAVWVLAQDTNGTYYHPPLRTVRDGRSNRNMARVLAPAKNAYVRGTVTLSGEFFSHNRPGHASLYLDDDLRAEMPVSQDYSSYHPSAQYGGTLEAAVNTATLADGPHTVRISIFDEAGQYVGGDTRAFIVGDAPPDGGSDPAINTPPAVSVEAPAADAVVGGSVSISFRAEDNVRTSLVQLFIDGLKIRDYPGGAKALDGAFEWDTLKEGNGIHEIRILAVDDAGLSASKTIPVRIQNTILGLEAARKSETAWRISRSYGQLSFSVLEDGKDAPDRFLIWRKTGAGEFRKIGEAAASAVSSDGFTYFDKYLEKAVSYAYRIEAVDRDGRVIGISAERTI